LIYHPIASNDAIFSFAESFDVSSCAIMFGHFFNTFEIWKQGNAKSPGIFSGGISISARISSCERDACNASVLLRISAKWDLYDSIMNE